MNAAIAIAADATTSVNPGVSSDAGPSPISPPSWKVSSQDAGSTGNNKLPFSPSSISKTPGVPDTVMIFLLDSHLSLSLSLRQVDLHHVRPKFHYLLQ